MTIDMKEDMNRRIWHKITHRDITPSKQGLYRHECRTLLPVYFLTTLLLLLVAGSGEAAGQTPVNIRSASLSGRSMEYWGNSRSACLVCVANDSETRQQWIMENAGNGSFYLKNVYAEEQTLNPYLSLTTANNNTYTMVFVSEANLSEANYYFRARFSLVELGDGTWGIKTMSGKNNSENHFYTYIGCDLPGSDPDYTIWGDKLTTNNGKWTIDGLSTISISRSAGQITITTTNTTDATVYYTIDGTDPTTSSTRQEYSAPFSDEGYGLVKAIVMKDGRPNSEMKTSFDYSKKFIFHNGANTAFCMLPGAKNGDDYEVNTYSLMRPSMQWTLEDADDGAFYIKNDSLGYYLSCNSSGAVRLKETKDASEDFKFWLRQGVDGSYRIQPKTRTRRYLRKADNNKTDAMGDHDGKINTTNYWDITPADHIPAPTTPFTLSTASDVAYYKLKCAGAQSYYVIPPTGITGNAQYANTAEGDGDNTKWYFLDAGADEWHRYYYIVSAVTGEYLYYNAAISGDNQSNAFITKPISESTSETKDRFKFAIANTTQSQSDGYYYVIPKAIQYENTRNYYNLLWRDKGNPLRTQRSRDNNATKWIFEPSTMTVAPPHISYDAENNKIIITCTTPGATIRYTTGDSSADNPTSSSGEVYNSGNESNYAGFDLVDEVNVIKAIAVKGDNSSSVTTYQVVVHASVGEAKHPYLIQSVECTDFYLLPGDKDNSDIYRITTSSLRRPSMQWYFVAAGAPENGNQYYYLVNYESGKYAAYYKNASNQDVLCMHDAATFNAAADAEKSKYKFRIGYYDDATAPGYYIRPMDITYEGGLYKNGNNANNTCWIAGSNDVKTRWNIIPLSKKPAESAPFTVSDATTTAYYKIGNVNASEYFIIPKTSSTTYATTSNENVDDVKWYFTEASHDDWVTYYNIVNAVTGEYLYFSGAIQTGTNNNAFVVQSGGTDDRYQFAVARTTESATSGKYYIVPKVLKDLTINNYALIWRDGTNSLKTQAQRDNDQRKWTFTSTTFNCATPDITYDETQGTITMTSPNNAPVYYVCWNDGETEPALDKPENGTLFEGAFEVACTHYKAIAARCSDGSDASTAATYELTQPFKCVAPRISYNTSNKKVTITSATTSATIYYIIGEGDFSSTAANFGGTLYENPFVLAEPQVVKAIAIRGTDWSTASVVTIWDEAPHYISASSKMTNMALNYVANEDFVADVTIGTESNPFTGKFDGAYHPISLSQPLFGNVGGEAVIKNVIVSSASVSVSGNVGAIANEASDNARIYNCGVQGGSVSGSGYVGSIVGKLDGTARVINCYSYADITGGSTVGGIVGYNSYASTSNDIRTMVMNCMFYGNITATGDKAPIYNGESIDNFWSSDTNQGLNNYNYFRFDQPYVSSINHYNCALGAEDRYLDRFEFFRHTLNSNRELAAWYITGNADDGKGENNIMAKWVLEPSQIGTDTPYPILKPQNTYPSVVNHDAANAVDIGDEKVNHNKGRKFGKLTVNISLGKGYPTGAALREGKSSLTLNITDKDTEHYDFNYRKVQLPYYNEVGTGNYTHNKVVTGWKMTVSGGTTDFVNTGTDAPAFNFVDRKSTGKDNYKTSGRVFSQGAYYEVPDGVTSISIEPYWADCVYLADAALDVTYSTGYAEKQSTTAHYTNGSSYPINGDNQVVYTDFDKARAALAPSSTNNVYDKAIVLVGNYHKDFGESAPGGNNVYPMTIMAADLNNDNEPDYCFFYAHNAQRNVTPIRFDFINLPAISMALKPTGATAYKQAGVFYPKGWFEITNTALIRFGQFEYGRSNVKTISAPLILMGGIYEQFLSCRETDAGNTPYIHIGGNAWFNEFNNGCHTRASNKTPKNPISVSGGDYNKFYLSGAYRPDVNPDAENAECYIDGGRFGEVAGAGMQKIDGSVTWIINGADIENFYGGGINPAKPITGNLSTTITDSWVTNFYGGPKFGDMATGKTVITNATGCHFGNYFGAGYGGNAFNRDGPVDATHDNTNNVSESTWNGYITSHYGREFNSEKGGISTSFDYEYLIHSNGSSKVARFYVNYASLSLASTHGVTSTLTDCTISHNFYGGGSLGSVNGDVTSTLTNCTVEGSVFGAGFSATTPTIDVTNKSNFVVAPSYDYNAGVFNDGQVKYPATVKYTWTNDASKFTLTGSSLQYFYDSGDTHLIYTSTQLSDLGRVTGTVKLNIEGNTLIKGYELDDEGEITTKQTGGVFGGGDASGVTGNTEVNIEATSQKTEGYNAYNVYGGGNSAPVTGNTEVNLKKNTIINGNVYGGGNEGPVSGSTTVNIEQ